MKTVEKIKEAIDVLAFVVHNAGLIPEGYTSLVEMVTGGKAEPREPDGRDTVDVVRAAWAMTALEWTVSNGGPPDEGYRCADELRDMLGPDAIKDDLVTEREGFASALAAWAWARG